MRIEIVIEETAGLLINILAWKTDENINQNKDDKRKDRSKLDYWF